MTFKLCDKAIVFNPFDSPNSFNSLSTCHLSARLLKIKLCAIPLTAMYAMKAIHNPWLA